jgi:hypothetical protein
MHPSSRLTSRNLGEPSITGHLRGFSDQPVAEIVQCGEPSFQQLAAIAVVINLLLLTIRLEPEGAFSISRWTKARYRTSILRHAFVFDEVSPRDSPR